MLAMTPVTILFVSLVIDLLGFTLILPLMPSILDYYSSHDEVGCLFVYAWLPVPSLDLMTFYITSDVVLVAYFAFACFFLYCCFIFLLKTFSFPSKLDSWNVIVLRDFLWILMEFRADYIENSKTFLFVPFPPGFKLPKTMREYCLEGSWDLGSLSFNSSSHPSLELLRMSLGAGLCSCHVWQGYLYLTLSGLSLEGLSCCSVYRELWEECPKEMSVFRQQ